jgi:hypothetical protein
MPERSSGGLGEATTAISEPARRKELRWHRIALRRIAELAGSDEVVLGLGTALRQRDEMICPVGVSAAIAAAVVGSFEDPCAALT